MHTHIMWFCAVVLLSGISQNVLSINFGSFQSGGVDYEAIPIATNVEESKRYFERRRLRTLQHFARQNPPNAIVNRTSTREITDWATARILLGLNNFESGTPTATINDIILNAKSTVFAPYGSSADDVPGCNTRGDYDFAAINLIRLAYSEKRHPGFLNAAAYRKLAIDLLPRVGKNETPRFKVAGFCGDLLDVLGIKLNESENHVLMMEISRYLSNQLRRDFPEYAGDMKYDNEAQGNNAWMLNHLRKFLFGHFAEYNSRPYQAFTVLALNVLHSYADDERVKRAALNVLDYITAFSVVQQNGLRRETPFRRQPKYESQTISYEGDGEMERLALLVGNYRYLEPLGMTLPPGDGQRHFILTAAASDYYPNDLLLSLAIDKEHNPYFQAIGHDNVEMYSSSGPFLISGGGKFDRHDLVPQIFGDNSQHGWARPTTLIPSRDASSDYRNYIRFLGHNERKKRQNNCVAPGFACGLDLRVPDSYEECGETLGGWRFYNFTSSQCGVDLGFYIAVQSKICSTSSCRDASASDNYGFFEALAENKLTYEVFKFRVIEQNRGRSYSSEGISTYQTSMGSMIQFEINAGGKSAIVAVDAELYDRGFNWPRARGDVLFSTTPHRLAIVSPAMNQRLILDMSDMWNPRRMFSSRPVVKRSPSLGGGGGRYFDDNDTLQAALDIHAMEIKAGYRVDAIRVVYRNGLATARGGNGGTGRRMDFQWGEYIKHVEVSTTLTGDSIAYMRVETNFGRVLEGGRKGDVVRFSAPEGTKIIGFHGHSGAEIDRLGVIYTPLFPNEPLPEFPILIKSTTHGANKGSAFDYSAQLSSRSWIGRVVIRSGNRIDSLGVDYTDGKRFRHGGNGGTEATLDLLAGEYLSKVYVSTVRKNGSQRISSFRVETNLGRHWVRGRERDLKVFSAPPGWFIAGFHGRAGKEVDQLGVIYSPIPSHTL